MWRHVRTGRALSNLRKVVRPAATRPWPWPPLVKTCCVLWICNDRCTGREHIQWPANQSLLIYWSGLLWAWGAERAVSKRDLFPSTQSKQSCCFCLFWSSDTLHSIDMLKKRKGRARIQSREPKDEEENRGNGAHIGPQVGVKPAVPTRNTGYVAHD